MTCWAGYYRIFTPIIFGLHGFYQQAALFTTNQEFQQYLQKIIPSQTQSQWNQNTLFKVPLAQQEQVSRGKATYWAENNFDLWTKTILHLSVLFRMAFFFSHLYINYLTIIQFQ